MIAIDDNVVVLTPDRWNDVVRSAPRPLPVQQNVYCDIHAPFSGRFIIVQETLGL